MTIENQTLFDCFSLLVKNYFEQEVHVKVFGICQIDVESIGLNLYDTTAIIQGKSAFSGVVLLSVDSKMAYKIVDIFLDSCDIDCEKDEMKNDAVGELLNIFIGNALAKISNFVAGVSFGAPYIIDEGSTITSKKGKILAQRYETECGFLTIAYLE
jgi:CheY-specific phosphatase CheX